MPKKEKNLKQYMAEGTVMGAVGTLVGYPFKNIIDPLTSGAYKEPIKTTGDIKKFIRWAGKKALSKKNLAVVLPADLLKTSIGLGAGWAGANYLVPKLMGNKKVASLKELGFKANN